MSGAYRLHRQIPGTSKTSANTYQTRRRSTPEDSRFQAVSFCVPMQFSHKCYIQLTSGMGLLASPTAATVFKRRKETSAIIYRRPCCYNACHCRFTALFWWKQEDCTVYRKQLPYVTFITVKTQFTPPTCSSLPTFTWVLMTKRSSPAISVK